MNDLKAQDKRVVLYAGAMGPPNGLELLIETASLLERTEPNVHFFLVGGGASQDALQHQARHLKNVEFWREVDRPVAQAAMRLSDCAVSIYRKSELFENGISPNKLFDYCLFAPRCVISCDESALAGLENLATYRCDPADAMLLGQTLLSALRTPARTTEERVALVRPFEYTQLAKRFFC
jgi:glycosyltransferase involved in cell wall biosynthesis